jgi:hypothetical protein
MCFQYMNISMLLFLRDICELVYLIAHIATLTAALSIVHCYRNLKIGLFY